MSEIHAPDPENVNRIYKEGYGPNHDEIRHAKLRQNMLAKNPDLKKKIEFFETNGYVILEDVISKEDFLAIEKASQRILDDLQFKGRNVFEGFNTKRAYSIISDSRKFDVLILNKQVSNFCEYYLFPNYLLSVSQLIKLYPNQKKQPFHHDAGSYTYSHLPRYNNMPLKLSTIWAVTDFTDTNGATVIVPKSHLWDNKKRYKVKDNMDSNNGEFEFKKLVMKKGSVAIYHGALIHSGGANMSNEPRIAIALQFSQPWIRPQENNMLTIPLDQVKTLPLRMKKMIGYSMHNAYGNVKGRHPLRHIDVLLKRYSKL